MFFQNGGLILKFSIFPNSTAINGRQVMQSYAQSLRDAGETVVENDMDADVAIIWSVLFQGNMSGNYKVWERFKSAGKPVIVLEVGAIKRNTTWRCGINGITGDAYHGPTGNGDDRFKQFNLELQPWREQKGHIVICGQHDDSAQWQTHNNSSVAQWIYNTVESWRAYDTKSTFLIRPHPRNKFSWQDLGPPDRLGWSTISRPQKVDGTYDDFDFDKVLENAKLVINYNSNPAIEAVLAGVPIMTHESSRCWPVASPIEYAEQYATPERQQWANDLCYTEWTEQELASGEPFKRIRPKLEELVK
tara:strand:+ start:891 stop:1802 length:912 start_codon:yes stop_codon:yes gene_type:complete